MFEKSVVAPQKKKTVPWEPKKGSGRQIYPIPDKERPTRLTLTEEPTTFVLFMTITIPISGQTNPELQADLWTFFKLGAPPYQANVVLKWTCNILFPRITSKSWSSLFLELMVLQTM